MDPNIKLSTIIENNKKVRHDLRGTLFTLNTSLIVLEKNPEKFDQVNKIMKKTTQSINDILNEWKEKDEKLSKNMIIK